jgi:hypothetical protein
MRSWLRAAVFGLLLGTILLALPSRAHAAGWLQGTPKQHQGPRITTPTCAFLKRQWNTVMRGIGQLPGMRQLIAKHQIAATQR